jgi:hypothetical protein
MNLSKKNYEIIAEDLPRLIKSRIINPGEKLEQTGVVKYCC